MFTNGTFYRIESEYGIGPYYALQDGGISLFNNRFNFKLRPAPPYDEKLKHFWRSIGIESQQFKFGFKNKAQLKKWFTKSAFAALKKESEERGKPFFVSIYKGRMVEGEKQIMFKREHATLLEKIPLGDFI